MIQITLACAAGMSTSLLVSKMEKYVAEQELDIKIISIPETQFDAYLAETDVLLLGPQVSFLEDKYRELFNGTKVKVTTIPILEFGRMDGEKVVKRALSLL